MKQTKEISRRQFLKGAAVGVAGLAAFSALGPLALAEARAEGATEAQAALARTNPFDLTNHTVLLNNGIEMPVFGLGTFQLNATQAENSVYWALESGYHLIDTAAAYSNEAAVGKGIQRAISDGLAKREEIFLTTKLWPTNGYSMKGVDAALQRLNLDYIDLLLLHQPSGDFVGGYKAMEEAVAQGKVRCIGISNFSAAQMEQLMAETSIVPAVQQVETHLHHQQGSMQDYLSRYGTAIEAWFPLGGRTNAQTFLNLPEVQAIAANQGKTPAQVIIRWHIQAGHVVIPGSTNRDHIQENIGAYDFELTDDEMNRLYALNQNAPFFRGMGGSDEETQAIMQGWADRYGLDIGN